jgi:caa(3)-type oxidase subunit IV
VSYADPHDPAAAAEDYANEHQHPPAKTGYLVVVYAVLIGFFVLATIVGFADFGEYRGFKVVCQLLVAGTQAAVLALFMMELRKADRVTALAAGAALFWTSILFGITMTDYLTRQLGAM